MNGTEIWAFSGATLGPTLSSACRNLDEPRSALLYAFHRLNAITSPRNIASIPTANPSMNAPVSSLRLYINWSLRGAAYATSCRQLYPLGQFCGYAAHTEEIK